MKHTLGPWKIVAGNCREVRAQQRWNHNGHHRLIARCPAQDGLIDYDSTESAANARLIAAAPDMLEALQKIAFDPIGKADASDAEVLDGVTQIARAAIAKATGEK